MDLNNLTGWIKNRLQKMILNFIESRSDLATKSKRLNTCSYMFMISLLFLFINPTDF